ncbi:MAG: type VI secretion system baseplate subunit TssF [Rhodocyclales bacterium GT-UBC]|nr:MAG: type VI secretion system baseplate subunit TssF [Rhodocyclales bacterium GT-UBC]
MLKQLLPYYEQELTYLRELSGEFAQRYPKIARRLLLDSNQSEDPHVERIIEGFAFLAARIHRKLDDEFPEITEAFLQVLYPHYTQPFPSCTILQFELDQDTPEITQKTSIPRHHPVTSPAVGGVNCQFRTSYEVDLLPMNLKSARLQLSQGSEHLRRLCPQAVAAITLDFETHGHLPFGPLNTDRLRFFLDGDAGLMGDLYELLQTSVLQIRVSDNPDNPQHSVLLPPANLSPVGFAAEDGLLDYDKRSFLGYRLLSEYFAFPEKFLFLDLTGLNHPGLHHHDSTLCIQIFLKRYPDNERHHRLAQTLNKDNFKLGCTPAINLFKHAADPIRISHQKTSYPVITDSRRQRAYEVIKIDSVNCAEKAEGQESNRQIPPFYSIQHHGKEEQQRFYWYATREPAVHENDNGTDLEIAFVDSHFEPLRPEFEVLSLNLTCSNRDLPEHLPFGGSSTTHADFSIPQFAIVKRVRPLRKPSTSLRAPAKPGLQWRLISHLSLNHLSIVREGREALQEMLALYNFSQSQSVSRQIQGIVDIHSEPASTLVTSRHFTGFARGIDITLTLDENAFIGSGMLIFAAVLERFFALYCGPNNFTRLKLRSKQQEQEIAKWPARAGEAIVI